MQRTTKYTGMKRTISASHRTIACIRTCLLLLALCGTRSAHRARTWRASKRDTAGACLSANLIYFGPDKKLIYREARPASLGKQRFSAPSREPEVTRLLAQVSGADQVTMKSLLAMRCKKKNRKRSRGKEEAESTRRNLD